MTTAVRFIGAILLATVVGSVLAAIAPFWFALLVTFTVAFIATPGCRYNKQ